MTIEQVQTATKLELEEIKKIKEIEEKDKK
jgi:hypothetical protein